jgi:KDO2-lipid IV(A) lauroyltransferase
MSILSLRYRRQCEQRIGKGALMLLSRVVHCLPLAQAHALGRLLGRLAPRISPRHFRRIVNDITLAFGDAKPSSASAQLARQVYVQLGMSLIEFLRLPFMSADEIRDWAHLEGTAHLEAALARGNGVILLTAHIGNWEVCGTVMGLSPYPTTAIAREQRDTAITNLFTRIREAHGLKVVPMTDVRNCIRVLKRNECLGVLGDLNARVPGVFVQFFGHPAATYAGAAYLARTTGAAIVPIFDERLPDGSHVCRLGAEVPPHHSDDRDRDLLIMTMRCQRVIEREIRRRPQDWFWQVARWKTRPEDVPNPERIPMEHRDLTPAEAAAALSVDPANASTC